MKKNQNPNKPEEHWVGMPEFKQENQEAIKRVAINFLTEEDIDKFNKATGLSVTMKTKGLFYPKPEPTPKIIYKNDEH